MRNIRTAFIAMAAIGAAALTASAANAQSAMSNYGPPQSGHYYSYGADRPNPSVSPNGWDVDNPRDQQLQGTR
jgi:hypothetical protein